MSANPEPNVWESAYVVSCLPMNDLLFGGAFEVSVERRLTDEWSVVCRGSFVDIDGNLESQGVASEREGDEWIARHLFDLPTALEVAKKFAPTLQSNGVTVEKALETYKETT